MNAKPITAPAHVILALLVQYTRERRSAEVERFASTDASTARMHGQRWERLKEAMNSVTVRAIRDGYDMDMLAWIVQSATDRQLETLACDATTNDQVLAMVTTMRTPKPKAPKASKPAGPVASARAERLQACTTRDQARELLTERRMTVAVLREISKLLGLGTQSKLRKDALIDSLIHFTVGMRLAHASVLNAK